jgi:hypothetical protein
VGDEELGAPGCAIDAWRVTIVANKTIASGGSGSLATILLTHGVV